MTFFIKKNIITHLVIVTLCRCIRRTKQKEYIARHALIAFTQLFLMIKQYVCITKKYRSLLIMKKKYKLLIIFLFIGFFTRAQNNELSQANTHFKAFFYKEAIPLYEQALLKDAFLGDAMIDLALCYYYTKECI